MKKLLIFLIFCSTFSMGAICPKQIPETKYRKILFAQLKKDFPEIEMKRMFDDARFKLDCSVKIPEHISPPEEPIDHKMNIYFRPPTSMLSEDSVRAGKAYLNLFELTFRAVEREYGVPRETIASILRIETGFGKHRGKRLVVNTLYSIYIFYPRKRKWAFEELKTFLRIAKENDWDIFTIKGSIAGAFGNAQFIPTSYKLYAVDGDGDTHKDLFNDVDAIYSIANYLKSFGWREGVPHQERALFGYNHECAYVEAVEIYSKALVSDTLPPATTRLALTLPSCKKSARHKAPTVHAKKKRKK